MAEGGGQDQGFKTRHLGGIYGVQGPPRMPSELVLTHAAARGLALTPQPSIKLKREFFVLKSIYIYFFFYTFPFLYVVISLSLLLLLSPSAPFNLSKHFISHKYPCTSLEQSE